MATTMKTPCELIVWYVLPMIRRGIADELIDCHHLRKADVARLYGVTDASINTYRNKKRGFHNQVVGIKQYFDLTDLFVIGGYRIMNGISAQTVICDICTEVKRSGLLDLIHEIVTGEKSNGRYAYSHVIFKIT